MTPDPDAETKDSLAEIFDYFGFEDEGSFDGGERRLDGRLSKQFANFEI